MRVYLSNDFVKTINDLNLMTSPLTLRVMDDFIVLKLKLSRLWNVLTLLDTEND